MRNGDTLLERPGSADQPKELVPRRWLFGEVRDWCESGTSALILHGAPGSGKTVATQQLASAGNRLFAVHAEAFCGATAVPPTAQAVLEAIANQFLSTLPGYSDQMLELYRRDRRRGITITFENVARGARATGIGNLHFTQRRTAESLVEDLFRGPFHELASQQTLPPGGVFILIDAIDGTVSGPAEASLDDVLLSALADIPRLRMLATRRSGPDAPAPWPAHVKFVDLEQAASFGDVQEYLSDRFAGTDLVTPRRLRHLIRLSGTNLLVARYLADNIDLLPLDALETMTGGLRFLDEVYDELLRRQARQSAGGSPDWEARFRTVLAIVAHGRDIAGMPVSLVERVAGRLLGERAGSENVRGFLRASRSFVRMDSGIDGAQVVLPYHSSFRDYLISSQARPGPSSTRDLASQTVDQVIAAELAGLWEHVAAEEPGADVSGEERSYLVGHFLEHLAAAGGRDPDRSPIRFAHRPHLAYQVAERHGVSYLLAQLNRLADAAGGAQPEMRLLNVVVGLQIRNLIDLTAEELDATFFQQLLGEACVIGADELASELRTEAGLRQLAFFMTAWATGRSDRLPVLHRLEHGQTVVTAVTSLAGHLTASATSDGAVWIWDIAGGLRIRLLAAGRYAIRALAVTARQHLLIAGGDDGAAYVWNAHTGERLRSYRFGAPIEAVTAVPDSDRILVATSGSVSLWDPTADRAMRLTLPTGTGGVVAALAANSASLAIVCSAGWTGLFDAMSGELIGHVDGSGPVTCAALSEDGRYLVAGGADGTVAVHDLSDHHLRRGERVASRARMSALGVGLGRRGVELIVGGDSEGSVTAWNAANGRQAWQHGAAGCSSTSAGEPAHRGEITAVAIAGPAGYALTGGRDGLVNVWDLATGERWHHFSCAGPVMALTSSRDGQYAVVGTSQGKVVVGRVWIAAGLAPRRGHDAPVSAAVAVGEGFVTVAGPNVRLWSGAGGQIVREWEHPAEVLSAARAGSDVITGSADGAARLLSSRRPEPAVLFQGGDVPVTAVAASGPDIVAVGSDDGIIRVWRNGRAPMVIEGGARVEQVLIDSGGTKAVSSHRDRSAYLWDLSSGTPIAQFRDFLMTAGFLGVNADESLVAIGSRDGTVLIADTRRGDVVTSIAREPGTLLTCLAFVGAGEHLAVGYDDGSSRLWNLVTSAWSPERLVHPGPVSAITPLGTRHFLSGSEDGSVGLWRLPDREHVVELRGHLLLAAPVTCLAARALAEPVVVGTMSGDVICVTCR